MVTSLVRGQHGGSTLYEWRPRVPGLLGCECESDTMGAAVSP